MRGYNQVGPIGNQIYTEEQNLPMAANTNDNMNSANKFLRKKLVDAVHVAIRVGCHGAVLLLFSLNIPEGGINNGTL